jgi:hypothetical protein
MSSTLPRNRSQRFLAPGRYVPVSYLAGIEVLPQEPRRKQQVAVRIESTTLQGTAADLFRLGRQILRAAVDVDPSLVTPPDSAQRPALSVA